MSVSRRRDAAAGSPFRSEYAHITDSSPASEIAAPNGRGVHLEQLAFAELDGADVAAAVGHGVAEEVLRGGEHSVAAVVALEAADEGDPDRGAEVGVLAVGLLDSTPPSVTREVEVR